MESPPRSAPRTVAHALAWFLAAAVIAAGGAGIVAGADHPAVGGSRPETTYRADTALLDGMAALQGPFEELSTEVDALAEDARLALTDLVGQRDDLLRADLDRGTRRMATISSRLDELTRGVAGLPFADRLDRLGADARGRLATARTALDAVEPLPGGWQSLIDGIEPAIGLAQVLDAHDHATFLATQFGVGGDFAKALTELSAARTQLDAARAARDRIASVADVSTLSAWIDRAAAYDAALTDLYTELVDSDGVMTARAKQLSAKVAAAQKALPVDNRTLVVIMGDVAQGGLNQAAIAIEEARGDLADAVAALH